MSWPATIGITLLAFIAMVIIGGLMWFVREHILPCEPYKELGAKCNVPRRHLESISSWSCRIFDAMSIRANVGMAFQMEAESNGSIVQNGRSFTYSLPKNHPLSIALLAAEYPNGPHVKELLAIIGYQWEGE
jgi:hypothetical protein